MARKNKILYYVDFTESSINGLNNAFSTAEKNQSDLILLHVIKIKFPISTKGRNLYELYEEEEKARDRLENICEKLLLKK